MLTYGISNGQQNVKFQVRYGTCNALLCKEGSSLVFVYIKIASQKITCLKQNKMRKTLETI